MKVYSVIEDANGKQFWFQDGVHVKNPNPSETPSDVMLIDPIKLFDNLFPTGGKIIKATGITVEGPNFKTLDIHSIDYDKPRITYHDEFTIGKIKSYKNWS